MDTEGVFSEGFASLKETIHEVVGEVDLFAFSLDFFVLDGPNGISDVVKVFPEEFESVQFIRSIDEQGFEVEKIEGRRGKEVKRVLFLLNWLFFFLFLFLFFLRSSRLWFLSGGLLFLFFWFLFVFLLFFFLRLFGKEWLKFLNR